MQRGVVSAGKAAAATQIHTRSVFHPGKENRVPGRGIKLSSAPVKE